MRKKMFKVTSLLLVALLLLGVIASCTSNTPTPTPTVTASPTPKPTTRSITDLAGNTYVIPTPELLERVAVLHTPIVQDIYIVGAGEKLVALSPQSQKWWLLQRMDPKVTTLPVPRSGPGTINMEELMKADPQLCIGLKQDHDTVVSSSNLICLESSSTRTGTYLEYQQREVRFFGEIFGKQEEAERYCSYLEDTFALIKERVATLGEGKKIKVLTALTNTYLGTYGGESYMQEWIELAGCENVAIDVKSLQSKDSYVELTMEQMLAYNPDIVLIDNGAPSAMIDNLVWQNMAAVKNGNVYRIPAGMFIWNRPCSEGAAQFPIWLAMIAYPQLFPDMTPQSEVKRFFKEIFNYELTDEDVDKILNPT
jgi:iron complex transport system substrate-binding protein